MVLGQISISTVLKIDEIKKAPFCQVSTWLGKNVMIRDVKIIELQIIDLTPFFSQMSKSRSWNRSSLTYSPHFLHAGIFFSTVKIHESIFVNFSKCICTYAWLLSLEHFAIWQLSSGLKLLLRQNVEVWIISEMMDRDRKWNGNNY